MITTEAYVPETVIFAGQPVAEVFALTLYNPDSTDPHGALTTHNPPPSGARGALAATATRGGQRWRIELPEIEVNRSTAVGCEYVIFGRVRREKLA